LNCIYDTSGKKYSGTFEKKYKIRKSLIGKF
jgi:hypothetical protein